MIGKPAGERDTLGRLLAALACLTGVVAVATFGVSAYGGYDTARSQMQLPVPLAGAAVLGMDVLAMSGWLALVALVGASWRLRIHAWSVFVIAAAGAIGANLSHATHRHLSPAGTVGVALAPVAFMLASHLFVVVRRHHVALRKIETPGDDEQVRRRATTRHLTFTTARRQPLIRRVVAVATSPVPVAPTTLAPIVVTPTRPVVSPVVPIATATPTTRRRATTTTPTDDIRRQAARRRVAAGEAVADVARDMFPDDKPDTRNARVRRWCADLPARDQRKEA